MWLPCADRWHQGGGCQVAGSAQLTLRHQLLHQLPDKNACWRQVLLLPRCPADIAVQRP